ncbi:uncharacterized protein LOC112523777 [Cynara cardunculus var. scolymus]|uniref:uncharacterized protein LOC112523777 n=1 Tax=Cynara cardunculus var. scolymus TaxID=59895 RepID=UPI000D624DCE|nr:uncharacterized protein LOC112523777 [Cynara cardunculus var. scolymus]
MGMPQWDKVVVVLSVVTAEVHEVQNQLSVMQVAIQANAEAIVALTSKADEENSHLSPQTEVMKQILATLQQPILAAEPSFTADDREQLHQAREANVIIAPKARDDDPPVTSAAEAGDLDDDDDDDDDDDESPDFPNAGKDLDDDDDDDDDFMIQYQRPSGATKGVAFRDSASQGEQGVKEAA